MHKLEQLFQLSAADIFDVILKNNRTMMNLKGAIAQEHLERHLLRLKREGVIEDIGRIDKDGKPDFEISFSGTRLFLECKNVQKEPKGKNKNITIDFWKTRYQKTSGPISRFYHEDEFQLLAACLFNRTGKWGFRFIQTSRLPRHPEDKKRYHNRVSLESSTPYGKYWSDSLLEVLKAAAT